MSDRDAESRNIARLLTQTQLRVLKMNLDEIIPAFDEAEAECLLLATTEENRLEVMRRVAEWKMKLFCDHDAPLPTVEKLHDDLLRLGYTHLEIEGSSELYLARYCQRNNQLDIARRIVQQFLAKLNEARAANDLEIWRNFSETSKRILSEIEEAGQQRE